MAQDLLTAIGTRLEAQLNSRESRLRSIEDSVKAQVSANPPAPFTLLADGTKQFGYAPAAAVTTTLISDSSPGDASNAKTGAAVPDLPDTTEIVSDATAPIAALLSATARLFTAAAAETKSVEYLPTESSQPTLSAPAAVETAATPPVYSNVSAFMEAVFAKPAVNVTTAPEAPLVATAVAKPETNTTPATNATFEAHVAPSAAATTSPTIAATASATVDATPSAAAMTSAARTTIDNAISGYSMLADGTKQFGFAPTGGVVNIAGINKTPPVPTEFGAGAVMRRKNFMSDTPLTVTRIGDGVVFANFTDESGTREMAFYPNQMDLVTAAP